MSQPDPTTRELTIRLEAQADHLEVINAKLVDIAAELHVFNLQLQRLGDQAEARDATILATAAALKDAEAARRSKSEQSWTPLTRAFAALAAAAGVIGAYLAVRGH